LIDTGSNINLIAEKVLQRGIKYWPSKYGVTTLEGGRLPISGEIESTISKGVGTLGKIRFIVTTAPMKQFDGILGTHFFQQLKAKLDFDNKTLVINGFSLPFLRTLKTTPLTGCHMLEQFQTFEVNHLLKAEKIYGNVVRLRAPENIIFPAWSHGILAVKCPRGYEERTMVIEPDSNTNSLVIGGTLMTCDFNGTGYLPVMNAIDVPTEITKGTHITWAYPLSSEDVDEIVQPVEQKSAKAKKSKVPKRQIHVLKVVSGQGKAAQRLSGLSEQESVKFQNPKELESLRRNVVESLDKSVKESDCPEHEKVRLRKLLQKYEQVFADKDEVVGKLKINFRPRIPLDTTEPLFRAQYPVPHQMRAEMQKSINEFLAAGIIQPSTSPYNSPTIIFTEKDGGK
jgi:hypothetical protein